MQILTQWVWAGAQRFALLTSFQTTHRCWSVGHTVSSEGLDKRERHP